MTTLPSLANARRFASSVLDRKWCACVQIIPKVESHFCWDGKKRKTSECLVIGKTTLQNFKRIQKALPEIHPYEVPEWIALGVKSALPSYLNWIDVSVRE
jgi:periplasmic divalent cation tolerance protein